MGDYVKGVAEEGCREGLRERPVGWGSGVGRRAWVQKSFCCSSRESNCTSGYKFFACGGQKYQGAAVAGRSGKLQMKFGAHGVAGDLGT